MFDEVLQYLFIIVLGNCEQDGLTVDVLDTGVYSPFGQQLEGR